MTWVPARKGPGYQGGHYGHNHHPRRTSPSRRSARLHRTCRYRRIPGRYTGNTLVSYSTDLRLFVEWCTDNDLRLMEVRRAKTCRDHEADLTPQPPTLVHHRCPRRRRSTPRRPRSSQPRRPTNQHALRPRPPITRPTRHLHRRSVRRRSIPLHMTPAGPGGSHRYRPTPPGLCGV